VKPSAQFKNQQRRHWDEVAGGWAAWLEWTEAAFKPVTDWLHGAAGWTVGTRTLDVGCGAGYPSLAAADAVGPNGAVVAVDLSTAMLQAAAAAARRRGLSHITFLEMDAEDLGLETASFDSATNAYGLMFYPDPARAVAELHRVLAPGGRVAVAVWDDPAKSPYFSVISRAAARQWGVHPPIAGGPGPFRFAAPDGLASLLAAAGFTDVRVESCPAIFACRSTDQYCQMFGDLAWKTRMSALSEDERARFVREVDEAVRPYRTHDRLHLVATSLCATGLKAG
jgi:enediyne biosynthesis protein CalE5